MIKLKYNLHKTLTAFRSSSKSFFLLIFLSKFFHMHKKKQQYSRERYKNISEDEKPKVTEYRKEY